MRLRKSKRVRKKEGSLTTSANAYGNARRPSPAAMLIIFTVVLKRDALPNTSPWSCNITLIRCTKDEVVEGGRSDMVLALDMGSIIACNQRQTHEV